LPPEGEPACYAGQGTLTRSAADETARKKVERPRQSRSKTNGNGQDGKWEAQERCGEREGTGRTREERSRQNDEHIRNYGAPKQQTLPAGGFVILSYAAMVHVKERRG